MAIVPIRKSDLRRLLHYAFPGRRDGVAVPVDDQNVAIRIVSGSEIEVAALVYIPPENIGPEAGRKHDRLAASWVLLRHHGDAGAETAGEIGPQGIVDETCKDLTDTMPRQVKQQI